MFKKNNFFFIPNYLTLLTLNLFALLCFFFLPFTVFLIFLSFAFLYIYILLLKIDNSTSKSFKERQYVD
ncbi:hypothetical protein DYBT9275_01703 [Dyadobacter sp. CECT 9275]|uniref:Uncharacterized protein n=1 Tax=Dyadobacter helix TaxID=2822344 RepID=A0A916J9G3_9BACT|nr:hypothetical protein DYBT9275_01703 [Dyadobacter sp. CECT 9275]